MHMLDFSATSGKFIDLVSTSFFYNLKHYKVICASLADYSCTQLLKSP